MNSPGDSNSPGIDPGISIGSDNNTLDLGSSRLPAEYDQVSIFAGHVIARQLAVAFLTLVVWEFVLTTDARIQLFWGGRWSIAKFMHVANLFTTLFNSSLLLMNLIAPSPSILYCNMSPWLVLVGTDISFAIIGFAMISRVYALWNRDKWVLAGLCSLCILHIGYYTGVVTFAYINGSWQPATLPFTGCLVNLGFDKLWTMSVPTLVFETVNVSLIVYKTWSIAAQRGIRTPVVTMLLEDGVAYYVAIIVIQLLSLVSLLVPSDLTLPLVRPYPTFAIIGIACNRLFIRLQLLLLGKGKGQSGFTTNGAWSSAVPDFTYRDGGTDGELNVRIPHTRLGKRGHQRYQSITGLDSDIRMETIGKITPLHDEGPEEVLEDPNYQAQALQNTASKVEVMIKVDGDGPGPFASQKSILDPERHLGREDIGSLVISQMGRYN